MAAKSSAEQIRAYTGPAVLSFPVRPFFLLASAWAIIVMALFMPVLAGHLVLPSAFAPIEWHVHELLFGYLGAIITGYVLTAVPNWSGRLPVVGTPLLWFVALWLAGRVAVLVSSRIGASLAGAIDMTFLLMLGFVIAREIIVGRNTRNLKILAVVMMLIIANALFHLEVMGGISAGYGARLGIAAAVFLIMLVGGRIVPSFTRNWLVRGTPGRLPKAFGSFDVVVLAVSAPTLLMWVLAPQAKPTAIALLAAALFNLVRLARWAGDRTTSEPLVVIMHVAFAFVPIGFVLVALGIYRPDIIAQSGALHGWTVGAIGLMTLAIMSRTILSHTRRSLTARWPLVSVYAAAFIAALARITAAFGAGQQIMLYVAAFAWIGAFSGFLVLNGPLLMRRSS